MRVLVAGANGAIGRAVVAELVRGGHEAVGLVRGPAGAEVVRGLGARAVVGDVLDRDGLLRALDGLTADAVVHEATALKKAPTRYGGGGITATNRLRTTGTAHLLDAARLLGARRFVVQSMVFGYGFVDHGPDPVTEERPFGVPRGAKSDAATAAFAAAEAQALAAGGIALRYGFVYGPGPASDRIVALLRRRAFPVPRGGGGTMGWLYVDDAATATRAAVERGRAGETYNVVDDEPARWGEVFDAMADAVGAHRPPRVPVALLRLPAPFLADQMAGTSMRVSNAKARDELGWRPSAPTFRHGVDAMARVSSGRPAGSSPTRRS
ncbi:NAD(P)-dependent oxidoreductase [Actinosynnema sp. NPDC051121]